MKAQLTLLQNAKTGETETLKEAIFNEMLVYKDTLTLIVENIDNEMAAPLVETAMNRCLRFRDRILGSVESEDQAFLITARSHKVAALKLNCILDALPSDLVEAKNQAQKLEAMIISFLENPSVVRKRIVAENLLKDGKSSEGI